MFRKYRKIVGKKEYEKFEKKDLIRSLRTNCNQGYEVVYQDRRGNLFDLNGFCMSDSTKEGKEFSDGSRLLIKGWMNVIQVGGYYQLFPVNSSFGFCCGMSQSSLQTHHNVCDEQKMASYKEVKIFYLLDDENGVIYKVKEFVFEEEPISFDLFSGKKPIVLFKGKEEFGFVHRGQFVPHNPRAKTIVHPMTQFLLQN